MADFNQAIGPLLAREGGARYTDDPDDPGGATKYGISQRAYPQVYIKDLTEAQARMIYKDEYWDALRADDILDQELAELVFDAAVNHGVTRAVKLLQATCGVSPDGVVGPRTLGVVNTHAYHIYRNFFIARVNLYRQLCQHRRTNKKYLLGWLNRLFSI